MDGTILCTRGVIDAMIVKEIFGSTKFRRTSHQFKIFVLGHGPEKLASNKRGSLLKFVFAKGF